MAWRATGFTGGDRGTRRGAKRCIVTEGLELIDHGLAKSAGIKGEFFQSKHEAKHYIALERLRRLGMVRPIDGATKWRQVPFPLYAVRPDGLKEKICELRLDFAYEMIEGEIVGGLAGRQNIWLRHYEDCKPAGGHREDLWPIKRAWAEAQYGIKIDEV